jgi:hypothetical protein
MLRPTVSRPVCLGIKHPVGSYDQIFITCVTVTVLILWGALSDERTCLSFIYAAGPCQRNISLVRVRWNSRRYFTVSELRLPFSSPPTTRRVTVEVFDPASTRGYSLDVSWKRIYSSTHKVFSPAKSSLHRLTFNWQLNYDWTDNYCWLLHM